MRGSKRTPIVFDQAFVGLQVDADYAQRSERKNLYAERQGFPVLAVGDELMEVKNRPDFEPKRW